MSIPAETQKLMRLLSQVIIADGHIHKTELDALIQSAIRLELKDEAGALLSAVQIHQWFNEYLQELNESWSTEKKDITLTRLILSLAEWPDKQAIVDTLEKISLSDGDYHVEEKKLISIVKTYWQFDGLNAPDSKIIR